MAVTLLASAVSVPSSMAQQAAYPSKPVRIISGNAPGGGSDILGRLIATRLTERFGKPFIVENIPGAGGLIAMGMVAKGTPDGYTMLVVSSSGIENAVLIAKVPYNVRTTLAPVSQLATLPWVMSINPGLPVNSFKEFLTYAKNKPGQINYASAGIGSTPHLLGELLGSVAHIKMTHVPFKGSGPALLETISGRTQVVFSSATAARAHARTGKLKPIAISSRSRSALFPDVPTMAASGLTGFHMAGWFGLLTTAGTPQQTILTLNRAVVETMKIPDVLKTLAAGGTEPATGTPEELRELLESGLAQTTKIVTDLNIKFD